jgi:hypothetical protein
MKIRVYQSYTTNIDHREHRELVVGDPLPIDDFLPYIQSKYKHAQNICWNYEVVSIDDITSEWLEGLPIGSTINLIGVESRDMWLSVKAFEIQVPVVNQSNYKVDSSGYALIKLEDSYCGTGYHIRDIMNLIETIKIYSNPNDFCAFVNEYISKQMIEDCENSEECAVYCRNPHVDFRVYPMGTCINPDDLANLDGNMVIIDEPREQRKHKTSPRELVWICKVSISNSAN